MKEPIGKIYGKKQWGIGVRQETTSHLLFVEEKPYNFYERSYTEIKSLKPIKDVKIIDGKEYVNVEYERVVDIIDLEDIDYDNTIWELDNSYCNDHIFYREKHSKRVTGLHKLIIDIVPHISVTFFYRGNFLDSYCFNFQDYNIVDSCFQIKKNSCCPASKNPFANFLYKLLGIYNIEWTHTALCFNKVADLHPNKITYARGLYGYGFNNVIFSKFTFPQLITMDVTKFKACEVLKSMGKKTDLDYLREFCERQDDLKDTLDFRVFDRPLTDLEIAKSSQKYLQKISTKKYHKAK